MGREYPNKIDERDERRHYDVFARLNQLRMKHEDGFRDAQEETRWYCKQWLEANAPLSDDQYREALPVTYCDLPHGDLDKTSYPKQACAISEREVWWNIDDPGPDMQERKSANRTWLEDKRKQLWHDGEGDSQADPDNKPWGWDQKNRRERYEQLQIATKYGSAWDEWKATHDTTTGKPKDESSWRDKSAKWHDAHLGITESPSGSNCDSRSDGIRTSQDGCANGTWLRYQPWCGCWAWSGLFAAGKVNKGDSWLASVASIEDYARAAKGPFRGWTTDGSKAKKGDLVVLFGRGQHVGTVRSVDSTHCHTWEGNTSSSSGGSQSNGGGSYKRSRSRNGETYGYALVE